MHLPPRRRPPRDTARRVQPPARAGPRRRSCPDVVPVELDHLDKLDKKNGIDGPLRLGRWTLRRLPYSGLIRTRKGGTSDVMPTARSVRRSIRSLAVTPRPASMTSLRTSPARTPTADAVEPAWRPRGHRRECRAVRRRAAARCRQRYRCRLPTSCARRSATRPPSGWAATWARSSAATLVSTRYADAGRRPCRRTGVLVLQPSAVRIRAASAEVCSGPQSRMPFSAISAWYCCFSYGTPGGSGATCQWTCAFPCMLPSDSR